MRKLRIDRKPKSPHKSPQGLCKSPQRPQVTTRCSEKHRPSGRSDPDAQSQIGSLCGLLIVVSELRYCADHMAPPTNQQIHAGQRKGKRKSLSRYKGVTRRGRRWIAQIGVNGRMLWLGSFEKESSAAREYDKAARRHFGQFACLNFPRKGEKAALLPS